MPGDRSRIVDAHLGWARKSGRHELLFPYSDRCRTSMLAIVVINLGTLG